MTSHGEPLKVLADLREAEGAKVLIAQLLRNYGGKIPPHTGAGVFGASIAQLIDTEFIELYDAQDVSITEKIRSIGQLNDWSLRRGYKVAEGLRGHEDGVRVVMTERLAEVQSVLGVSLTQLLEDLEPGSMRVRPVFGKAWGSPSTDVFVLMPFHTGILPVYEDHIHQVCQRLKLACRRADDLAGSSNIISDVWCLIANSRLIIADCTGKNPNVFYELGVAHTLGKRVIIIAQSPEDIPFDIRHIRYIRYEYTPRGMKELETTLEKFIREECEQQEEKNGV